MFVGDLATPALVVDVATLDHNIDAMAAVRPHDALRSHVKAHKSSSIAAYVARRSGSGSFCCATLREAHGLIRAGLGNDVLIANQTLDVDALTRLVRYGAARDAGLILAVDSPETVQIATIAQQAGPLEVLIDVNVGMPRCGVAATKAGELAELARRCGLQVRGVMGYEGHVVGNADRQFRIDGVAASMDLLRQAAADVGGDITSAGATGTYDMHNWVGEVQAGSFVLMDTAYGALELPFAQALSVISTVLSVNATDGYAVGDAGLKAFGMDHGDPTVVGHTTFFCSDEHVTFVPGPSAAVGVGDRIELHPAHIDPTMVLHERVHVIERRGDDGAIALDAEVIDTWDIDLRGW